MASGSIRERKTKKGTSYQLTIEAGVDPITGERIRQYKTFKGTRKQAEKELSRLIQEMENGTCVTQASPVSLTNWMKQWLELYCINIEGTTRHNYDVIIRNHIEPFHIGKLPLKSLRNTHIQEWVNALVDMNLRAKTIRNSFICLKSALSKAVTLKMISYNPCEGTTLPKVEAYEASIYDQATMNRALQCAAGTEWYFILLLEISTGVRRGELAAVRWQDIDFETNIMHIHRNRVPIDGVIVEKQPKSRAGIRDIYLGDKLMEVVKQEYARYQSDKELMGDKFYDDGFVIRRKNGEPYDPMWLTYYWKKFQKDHDLPIIRFHDLRHSHTTALIESGVDIKTVQKRLGHSNVNTTLTVYAHVTKKSSKEAADKVDKMFFSEE
ncbi:MAG: tyrosine-type recombinase/integrase [Clostridia bacterium]|nr:tyrosine-type recombinase/integrase [Clostridia bacterium]